MSEKRGTGFVVDPSEHIGLVHAVVQKMRWEREEYDELVSLGMVALCRAAGRFDPAAGSRFSTYAYRAIELAIVADRVRRRRAVRDERRTVALTDNAARYVKVRDQPGRMEADDARRHDMDKLAHALRVLNAAEINLLIGRANGITLGEIGASMGICVQQVRNIERASLDRARERVGLPATGLGMLQMERRTAEQIRKARWGRNKIINKRERELAAALAG